MSLLDVLGIIQSHLGWSRYKKGRKLKYYKELFVKDKTFAETLNQPCRQEEACVITTRASCYLINDICLKEDCHQHEIIKLMYHMLVENYFGKVTIVSSNPTISASENDIRNDTRTPLSSSTPKKPIENEKLLLSYADPPTSFDFEQSFVKPVTSLTLPPPNKVLPPLEFDYSYTVQGSKKLKPQDKVKIQECIHDCNRLRLYTSEEVKWYVQLIEDVGVLAPKLSKLIGIEMKELVRRMNEGELNHREFSLLDEYRNETSWVVKLLLECVTKDRTWTSGTTEKRGSTRSTKNT